MYSVIFADDKKFIFTKHQIMLIPYFNALLSSSFLEKDIINISSSSIGFEYIHIYATMDEVDIIDPNDKYLFVLKQCNYFAYNKLKLLLEQKYGYKIDITDIKEKTGKEFNIKLKYLGKINISSQSYPIYFESKRIHSKDFNLCLSKYFNKHVYNSSDWGNNSGDLSRDMTQLISKKCICGKNCDNSGFKIGECGKKYKIYWHFVEQILPNIADKIYIINPIYEYPEYSTDEEINEIFKKRYRKKYNTYFVKMFKNIILLTKDDIICVKIDDSYKLLTEITEDDYKNIESIIIEKEPKFNYKYFIKYIDDNYEIFENI
jgi:hypothetical protein